MTAPDGFDALRAVVSAEPALQARLRAQTAWEDFAAEALRVAADAGVRLGPGELEDAHRAARRAWIERGV